MSETRLEGLGEGRFRLSGDLGFDSVAGAWAAAEDLFAPFDTIELDLGAVERADSAGVALLVAWARRARERGARMVFRQVPEQMTAIIDVSDLREVLPLAD